MDLITKRIYDEKATFFDGDFKPKPGEMENLPLISQFMRLLPGNQVLDIGAGPGHQAQYMSRFGLNVVCADFSFQMAKICKGKKLEAVVMDIERLAFRSQSFDGIYAQAVILHIRRPSVSAVIQGLIGLLKPQGVLGLAVMEGDSEGYKDYPGTTGRKRWFTYFTHQEIKEYIGDKCSLEFEDVLRREGKPNFLYYVFRKK